MSGISFEEMKVEFIAMDQEIKNKAIEIEQLKEALHKAEVRLAEREDACSKMVDQIEELHENLAELDVRFERSEEYNKRLIEEKEELTIEMQNEIKDIKQNLENTSLELNGTKLELSRVKTEYDVFKSDSHSKIETVRTSLKQSLESMKQPLTGYLEKNKGSKTPMKKTKGYRLLKNTERDLKNILATTTNNNI